MDRLESESLRIWREEQYARRGRSRAWLIDRAVREHGGAGRGNGFVRPPRPARCGWALGVTGVRLHGGKAYMSGLEHCASPWCCPVCTPVIRARRARDLRDTIRYWQEDPAHSLAFVTLTIPHGPGDGLADMIALVGPAWSRLAGSQRWRRLREKKGIRHYVRSMEITWSPGNGWHVHLHLLLYLDQAHDSRELQESLRDLWARNVHALAPERRPPSKRHGVLVETAGQTDADGLAGYLAKSPDRRDLASEMTRADRKHGRKTSLAPFQFLDRPVIEGFGKERAERLWCEYVDATWRHRTITWSRHLRAEAGLAGSEPTDRQIIDQTIHGIEAISLTHSECKALTANPNILSHVLQKTETGEIPLALDLIDAVLE